MMLNSTFTKRECPFNPNHKVFASRYRIHLMTCSSQTKPKTSDDVQLKKLPKSPDNFGQKNQGKSTVFPEPEKKPEKQKAEQQKGKKLEIKPEHPLEINSVSTLSEEEENKQLDGELYRPFQLHWLAHPTLENNQKYNGYKKPAEPNYNFQPPDDDDDDDDRRIFIQKLKSLEKSLDNEAYNEIEDIFPKKPNQTFSISKPIDWEALEDPIKFKPISTIQFLGLSKMDRQRYKKCKRTALRYKNNNNENNIGY